MSARRTAIIESAALLMLGALGLTGGLTAFLRADARMQSSILKPGMYVLCISGALILTALVYAYLNLRKAEARAGGGGARADAEGPAGWIVLAVFGVVAAYGLLIPLIGYVPATVLFLVAQFRLLGVQSWVRNGLITIAVSAIFHVVFIHYGGMVFPHGSLLE